MSKAEDAGDYEVGYGKPPKQHQFKAGHTKSKGKRAKRKPSLQSMIEHELLEMISIISNDKRIKLPAVQLILRRAKLKALNGDEKATLLTMKLAQLFLPPDPEEEGAEDELNAAELAVADDVYAAKALFGLGGGNE